MAVELATDLHRMSPNATGEFRKGETWVFLFPQHFSDALQPRGNKAAAWRRVLPVGQQELQDHCLNVQPRKVVSLTELAVKSRAEGNGGGPGELAG